MTRNNVWLTAAVCIGVLATAACGNKAPVPGKHTEAASAASGKAPANKDWSALDAGPRTIDEPAVAVAQPQIVAQRDAMVEGEPACAFEVRYPDAVDQPVVWNGSGCAKLTARFTNAQRLRQLGHFDRLSEEVRDDLARSGDSAFYVEGQFSSILYPLNSAGYVYAVPLAD